MTGVRMKSRGAGKIGGASDEHLCKESSKFLLLREPRAVMADSSAVVVRSDFLHLWWVFLEDF